VIIRKAAHPADMVPAGNRVIAGKGMHYKAVRRVLADPNG